MVTNSRLELEASGKVVNGSVVDSRDHDNSGTDKLNLQGAFHIGFLLHGPDVSSNERAQQANANTDCRNDDGEDEGVPSSGDSDAASDDESGAS
mmetsp:Transcript_17194/g.39729  ORF Transcript_17194/g.39729 Transcript_17194/m.39729 type:complete len:94 (+) Transcript_17194:1213-1494(+)